MKKNGFTIAEVLAVVVILAILIGISVPIYNNMQNSTIEKEYDSKVAYIENKVLEYAEANNVSNGEIISVGKLINQGYITADRYEEEMPFLENPKNKGENLACRIVEITQENYEYRAKLSEESDCELINLDSTIAELGIKAYGIESNGDSYKLIKVIGSDDIRDLEWSKEDVLITINPTVEYNEMTIGINGTIRKVSEIVSLNVGDTIRKDAISTKNVEVVTGQNITKAEIMISVNKKETSTGENEEEKIKEEVRTVRLQVKIDKEKPTINTSTSDRWSNVGKDSTIYVSDGSGSGPSCVFVRETNVKPVATACGGSGSYPATNGVAKLSRLEEGTYYIWAMDKAGNMTDASAQLLIQNIDSDGPSCDYQGEKKVWSKEDVTVKFGCKDDGVGCKTTSSGRVETFTTSDGNGQVRIEDYDIEDNLGNKVTCSGTANVYIDKIAPTVTADRLSVTSQDSRFNTSTVNVSITTTDTHSGIASICFNTSSSTNGCNWINITPTDSSKNQGPNSVTQSSTVNLGSYNGSSHTIYVHVRDRVGNESQTHSLTQYKVYTACTYKTETGRGGWSTCSNLCGSGTQTRAIYYKDTYIGQTCSNGTDSQSCYVAPVRGSQKSSTYSSCPSCGSGTYSITYYRYSSANSSVACSDETVTGNNCNKPACCSATTPSYGAWSSCTKACNSYSKSRTITYNSSYNGTYCSSTTQTESCGSAACQVDPTVSNAKKGSCKTRYDRSKNPEKCTYESKSNYTCQATGDYNDLGERKYYCCDTACDGDNQCRSYGWYAYANCSSSGYVCECKEYNYSCSSGTKVDKKCYTCSSGYTFDKNSLKCNM